MTAHRLRIGAITPHAIEELRYFRFDPTPDTPDAIFDFIPGQFLKVATPSQKGTYFAIASAPQDGRFFDLLIKRVNPVSAALFEMTIGDEVEADGPQGKGFPIEPLFGQDLVLIGVGTGIAPLRSVVRAIIPKRDKFGRVVFIYGVLTPRHLCYPSEAEEWSRSGIEVLQTVTYGEAGWRGRVGFVQEIVREWKPDPERTSAMLVGMPEMVKETSEALLAAGVSEHRILLNY